MANAPQAALFRTIRKAFCGGRGYRSLPTTSQNGSLNWHVAETVGKDRAGKLLSLEIKNPADIEAAFDTAASARAEGLLVTASGHLFARAEPVK